MRLQRTVIGVARGYRGSRVLAYGWHSNKGCPFETLKGFGAAKDGHRDWLHSRSFAPEFDLRVEPPATTSRCRSLQGPADLSRRRGRPRTPETRSDRRTRRESCTIPQLNGRASGTQTSQSCSLMSGSSLSRSEASCSD